MSDIIIFILCAALIPTLCIAIVAIYMCKLSCKKNVKDKPEITTITPVKEIEPVEQPKAEPELWEKIVQELPIKVWR